MDRIKEFGNMVLFVAVVAVCFLPGLLWMGVCYATGKLHTHRPR